ncbi:MAG TPA: hypothetical protein VEV41_19005 [Terriglobales bacterium]|nr:hypothetical protein [Terriglobales bacterium]
MSLKIRFRFDGRCNVHPRYNPESDGRPQPKHCDGCESLYVIFLYTSIARRKAESGEGLTVRNHVRPEEESSASTVCDDESPSIETVRSAT